LPLLSAYLGHREPKYTYWYLHAAPELLAQAGCSTLNWPHCSSRFWPHLRLGVVRA
jgi:hypothetical protein